MLQRVRGKNLQWMILCNLIFSTFPSHLFSLNEYNHTNFSQQELNTAKLCLFLIPRNYLHLKTCRKKNVFKVQHSQLCILLNEKLTIMGFLCSIVDFSNSVSYKSFRTVLNRLMSGSLFALCVFSSFKNLWSYVSIYPLSGNRNINYL